MPDYQAITDREIRAGFKACDCGNIIPASALICLDCDRFYSAQEAEFPDGVYWESRE